MKEKTRVQASYFNWLVDRVKLNNPVSSYYTLSKKLHDIEFKYIVAEDENRLEDAFKLREEFEKSCQIITDENRQFLHNPVSMLEMLIALAFRMEDILFDAEEGEKVGLWVEEILRNLNLTIFTDSNYYRLNGDVMVEDIIDRVLERDYDANGHGNIFPLRKTNRDQRNIPIWAQLNEYINENYYNDI